MVRAKPSRYISEKVGSPVRQFITAGNEDELVPDKSVFKAVFVKGIKDGYGDRNEDGFITGEELGAYLAEEVVNYSRGAQHPQYGKINNPALDRGDFVFVKQELSEAERLKQKVASLQSQLQEQKKLVAAMDSDQGAITQTIKAEPTPYVAQPGPEAKLKAVILPWKLKGLGIVRTLRDSLEKCIPKANNIQIISSYYSKNDASVFVDIDSNYFFNYSKPDVDRISEFVSGLDGDIAIIGDVNCGSGPLDYIKFQKVYFVNVISRQVFSAKESRGITFQTFGNRASVFLCGAIEKFEQGELKTIGY